MTKYTSAVGSKFHKDGSLRTFPGNTIVSNTEGIEPLHSDLIWIQDQYRKLSFASKLSFMPPPSFHMTFFELLCDQVRKPDYWSKHLSLDAPLEETDSFFASVLGDFAFPETIRMNVDDLKVTSLRLTPVSPEEERLLRQKRDELAGRTGIRMPNHDRYSFHITLDYIIVELTDAEKEEFEAFRQDFLPVVQERLGTVTLGTPEYVLFNDMGRFLPARDWTREQVSALS